MGALGMKMHDVEFFTANQFPQPRHRPHIQIVAHREGPKLHVESSAALKENTARMSQKHVVMSLAGKIRQQAENLRLAAAPVFLRIDVQNFQQAGFIASAQVFSSPPARVPRA